MKKALSILIISVTILTACKYPMKKINAMLTIIEDHDGRTINEGDFLILTFTEKTPDGKLFSGSSDYDERPAQMFREPSYFKGDIFGMLGYLSEGDSAQFKISVDSMVNKQGRKFPKEMNAKYLIYNVKIKKVITRGTKNDSLYNAAIENEKEIQQENAKNGESAKIARYLTQKMINPVKTTSGLNYVITNRGLGRLPIIGDSVLVNYTAKTLTNKVFETTYINIAKKEGIYKKDLNYTPIKLQVIKQTSPERSGFMEAISMFPKGTKVKLVIPSKLAYRNEIYKQIQPYTPIICDLEIVDIITIKKKL